MIKCPLCNGDGEVSFEKFGTGDRMRGLRGGRTQTEVAPKLGISRAQLTHIEAGTRKPSLQTIVKAANFFGVTTDFLLGRDGIDEEG